MSDPTTPTGVFRIGVTRDIRTSDGGCLYPLEHLAGHEGVSWEFLADNTDELTASQVSGFDAVIVFGARVTANTLVGANPPVLITRLGVGYDKVDIDACTRHGTLVTVTPDGVRRPMAAGAMAFILALAHRVVEKDRLLRSGRWEPFAHVGQGVAGRTLGVLGLGNIGRELCVLAEPFGMSRIAYDVVHKPLSGVELADLETVLTQADFLCITLPLTADTHHLINSERLALLKPTAHLINISRGPIVDQAALTAALRAGELAGAALDVFENEPLSPDEPLLSLENVIAAPHAIGLTDEMFAASGQSACESILSLAAGQMPAFVVNPEARQHPRLQAKIRP
jgi:phosphoglycerate dehydrogenase-like enzyme